MIQIAVLPVQCMESIHFSQASNVSRSSTSRIGKQTLLEHITMEINSNGMMLILARGPIAKEQELELVAVGVKLDISKETTIVEQKLLVIIQCAVQREEIVVSVKEMSITPWRGQGARKCSETTQTS